MDVAFFLLELAHLRAQLVDDLQPALHLALEPFLVRIDLCEASFCSIECRGEVVVLRLEALDLLDLVLDLDEELRVR